MFKMSPSHPCVQLACLNVSVGWAWLGVPNSDSTCWSFGPFTSPAILAPKTRGVRLSQRSQHSRSLRPPFFPGKGRDTQCISFYVSLQLFSLTETKMYLP